MFQERWAKGPWVSENIEGDFPRRMGKASPAKDPSVIEME
jgi:hypothetical protein